MALYEVDIDATFAVTIPVEANSPDEAMDLAKEVVLTTYLEIIADEGLEVVTYGADLVDDSPVDEPEYVQEELPFED